MDPAAANPAANNNVGQQPSAIDESRFVNPSLRDKPVSGNVRDIVDDLGQEILMRTGIAVLPKPSKHPWRDYAFETMGSAGRWGVTTTAGVYAPGLTNSAIQFVCDAIFSKPAPTTPPSLWERFTGKTKDLGYATLVTGLQVGLNPWLAPLVPRIAEYGLDAMIYCLSSGKVKLDVSSFDKAIQQGVNVDNEAYSDTDIKNLLIGAWMFEVLSKLNDCKTRGEAEAYLIGLMDKIEADPEISKQDKIKTRKTMAKLQDFVSGTAIGYIGSKDSPLIKLKKLAERVATADQIRVKRERDILESRPQLGKMQESFVKINTMFDTSGVKEGAMVTYDGNKFVENTYSRPVRSYYRMNTDTNEKILKEDIKNKLDEQIGVIKNQIEEIDLHDEDVNPIILTRLNHLIQETRTTLEGFGPAMQKGHKGERYVEGAKSLLDAFNVACTNIENRIGERIQKEQDLYASFNDSTLGDSTLGDSTLESRKEAPIAQNSSEFEKIFNSKSKKEVEAPIESKVPNADSDDDAFADEIMMRMSRIPAKPQVEVTEEDLDAFFNEDAAKIADATDLLHKELKDLPVVKNEAPRKPGRARAVTPPSKKEPQKLDQ